MNTSVHAKPFAFDRIFTMPKAGTDKREDSSELVDARCELELFKLQFADAVESARVGGFDAGLAQAREEIGAALLAATDALHVSIEAVEGEYTVIEQRLSSVAAEVAMAAAEGLAGRAFDANPALPIDDAIGRVLLQVARGQELQIYVHPDLLEPMEALIVARQGRERRRLSLTLLADPELAKGDALISWEQGGLALSAEARRAAILAELGLTDTAKTPVISA